MSDEDNHVNDDTSNITDDGNDKGQDDSVAQTEDVEKLKEQNVKLFERAKKAEGFVKQDDGTWLKKPKPQPVEQPKVPDKINSDSLSREEAILIAQGMEADDLDELKAVAKAKDLPLLKAKETPLFQGYLEKIEAERKKEKAKLSASKGSPNTQADKSVSEMTPEEHKEFFKETMKNVR